MVERYEFAYLQLYSRWSAFGGLSEATDLAESLFGTLEGGKRVAATLTDTFSLVAYPEWRRLLAESAIAPLAGLEVALSYEGAKGLPYSLLLLAESRQGYSYLCQLASLALHRAGTNPLTAYVTLEELEKYKEGLIAISPYYGGPVSSTLRHKATEAKNRASSLRDIFGPEHFYLGVSPIATTLQPGSVDTESPQVKFNAALVKLARDLKIGLVGTGEARYLSNQSSGAYAGLRGRMSRTVSSQFPPSSLQRAQQDWLYAPPPIRPSVPLHLRSTAELVAYYNNNDWPGALLNNRNIAERAARWNFDFPSDIEVLRAKCEEALPYFFPDDPNPEIFRPVLEKELAEIEEMGLAASLLAATQIFQSRPSQLIILQESGNSLVANLLSLKYNDVKLLTEEIDINWSHTSRLLVGLSGRAALLSHLNDLNNPDIALPLAVASSEAGSLPVLHPRLTLISLYGPALFSLMPLQPAENNQGQLQSAVLAGSNLPPGIALVEVVESKGVAWVQLAIDKMDALFYRQGKKISARNLLPSVFGEYEDDYHKELINEQLDFLKQQHPAAYYAAALELAQPTQRAGLAEVIRLAGLKLLPPDIANESLNCSLEDETSIRVGINIILPQVENSILAESTLQDVAAQLDLTAEGWERLAWSGALDAFGPREQLAAGAQALTRYGAAYRERAAQEHPHPTTDAPLPQPETAQMTLFDLFGDFEIVEDILPELPTLELPEYTPLSRLELLRKQRAGLGFYTTEHPLWDKVAGTTSDTSRNDPLDLVVALQDSGNNSVLLVSGMVVGLRHLPIAAQAGNGQELTVLRLEDWSGQAELIIPPATSLSGALLEEGAAIAALVQRVLAAGENAQPVLLAKALDAYPPTTNLKISEDEVVAIQLADELDEPPLPDGPPPPDYTMSADLFGDYAPQPIAPTPTSADRGKGAKKPATPPRPTHKSIHITLPATTDPDQETDLMLQVREVLQKFPGDDELVIYLPKEGGGFRRFRPQTLNVGYSPMMAHEVELVTGPGSVRVEEI